MIVVVPHIEVPPDQIGDPSCTPRLVGKAVLHCTLPQEGANLFKLGGGEARGTSSRHCRLKTTGAFQTLLPVADGVYGDTEVLGNLLL